MTAAAAREYEAGWHHGGQDERCVGVYAGTVCMHPWHRSQLKDGPVNADTFAAKDTHNDATFPSGVPADPSSAPDLASLVAAVAEASRAVAGWLDRAQEVEALDVLATVRAARVAIAQIESVVESRSGRLMSGDVIEWPGGVAERRFGKERKTWRHDDLIHTVTRQIAQTRAADATSGEVDDMLAALLSDALDEFAATHRPDWRMTPLKAMGIDPDEYCHAESGKVSVRILAAGEQ